MMTMMKFAAALLFTATLVVASSNDKDQTECGVSNVTQNSRRRLADSEDGFSWKIESADDLLGAIIIGPIIVAGAVVVGAAYASWWTVKSPFALIGGACKKAWTPTQKEKKVRDRLQQDPDLAITYLKKHKKFASKLRNVLLIKQVYIVTKKKYQAPYMVELQKMLGEQKLANAVNYFRDTQAFQYFPDWAVVVLNKILEKEGPSMAIMFFQQYHKCYLYDEEWVHAGAQVISKLKKNNDVHLRGVIGFYQKDTTLGYKFGQELKNVARKLNISPEIVTNKPWRKDSDWSFAPPLPKNATQHWIWTGRTVRLIKSSNPELKDKEFEVLEDKDQRVRVRVIRHYSGEKNYEGWISKASVELVDQPSRATTRRRYSNSY